MRPRSTRPVPERAPGGATPRRAGGSLRDRLERTGRDPGAMCMGLGSGSWCKPGRRPRLYRVLAARRRRRGAGRSAFLAASSRLDRVRHARRSPARPVAGPRESGSRRWRTTIPTAFLSRRLKRPCEPSDRVKARTVPVRRASCVITSDFGRRRSTDGAHGLDRRFTAQRPDDQIDPALARIAPAQGKRRAGGRQSRRRAPTRWRARIGGRSRATAPAFHRARRRSRSARGLPGKAIRLYREALTPRAERPRGAAAGRAKRWWPRAR
jgi:hypothetical protein